MRSKLTVPACSLLAVFIIHCGGESTPPNNNNTNTTPSGNPDSGTPSNGTDTTRPTFAGLSSATPSGTTVTLTWSAATDDQDQASEIVYRIYRGSTSGGQSFTAPAATTAAGHTTHALTAQAIGTHYFVVRAVDSSGNEDTNTVERSATITGTPGGDTTPPTMNANPSVAAVYADTAASAGQLNVSWAAATDNVSAAAQIKYQLCSSATATGCNTFTATLTTGVGATTAQLTGLTPRTQYYVSVRAVDAAGNVETAAHQASATTATSYQTNILQGIFLTQSSTGGCVNCHTGGWSYDEAVNQTAANATCSLKTIVVPGNPLTSLLYIKMVKLNANDPPTMCGNPMPAGAGAMKNAGKIQTMFDWITQGARRN